MRVPLDLFWIALGVFILALLVAGFYRGLTRIKSDNDGGRYL
jgi:hypothetical protein